MTGCVATTTLYHALLQQTNKLITKRKLRETIPGSRILPEVDDGSGTDGENQDEQGQTENYM